MIYILDEPCKGLHYRDITKIIKATRDLIHCGNTVIAIEHNKQYIASSDYIVELGPVGGPDGGYLISRSSTPQSAGYQLALKQTLEAPAYFEVNNINFRNIHGQNARYLIGGITCITGVSGSGKSTLASVVVRCFSRRSDNVYDTVKGRKNIRRVIQVNQAPIGRTPRLTIVSYLEIFDEIRTLFSKTDTAKRMKIGASSFILMKKRGYLDIMEITESQVGRSQIPNKVEISFLKMYLGSWIQDLVWRTYRRFWCLRKLGEGEMFNFWAWLLRVIPRYLQTKI